MKSSKELNELIAWYNRDIHSMMNDDSSSLREGSSSAPDTLILQSNVGGMHKTKLLFEIKQHIRKENKESLFLFRVESRKGKEDPNVVVYDTTDPELSENMDVLAPSIGHANRNNTMEVQKSIHKGLEQTLQGVRQIGTLFDKMQNLVQPTPFKFGFVQDNTRKRGQDDDSIVDTGSSNSIKKKSKID